MPKIALSSENSVSILSSTGPIEEKDVPVLKAGVGKLIRDGKNQVVIELNTDRAPDTLVRELMQLDLLARELSGRLVVVAPNSELQGQLANFAKPMTLEVFPERAAAMSFFSQSGSDELLGAAAPAPVPAVVPVADEAIPFSIPEAVPAAPAPVADLMALDLSAPPPSVTTPVDNSAAEAQRRQLKTDIRDRELKDNNAIRQDVARLTEENKTLLDRLGSMMLDRRRFPNEASYVARIAELEARVEKLLEDLGQAPGEKK